jgi:hypothetical protein
MVRRAAAGVVVLLGTTAATGFQILGVSVSPAKPVAQQEVTITVTGGFNPCGAIGFNYGDDAAKPAPQLQETRPAQGLPFTWHHTYANAGTYTLHAYGEGNCTGTASTVVTVVPGADAGNRTISGMPVLINLCKLVNCAGFVGPHIDSVTSWAVLMPVAGTITPGAIVVVSGQNFGNTPATLKLAGLKNFAIGEILPWVEVTVEPNHWHDTVIVGTIPLSVKSGKPSDPIFWDLTNGLKDQNPKIIVSITAAKESNAFPVVFRAVKDFRALPACGVPHVMAADVQLPAGFVCGTGADYDSCNGWHDPDDSVPWFMGKGGCDNQVETLGGYHADNWCCQFSPDEGTDTYPLALKNSWVFEDWSFVPSRSSDDVPLPDVVAAPLMGFASSKAQIHWKTNANDWVAYNAWVFIKGPRGVPWK